MNKILWIGWAVLSLVSCRPGEIPKSEKHGKKSKRKKSFKKYNKKKK